MSGNYKDDKAKYNQVTGTYTLQAPKKVTFKFVDDQNDDSVVGTDLTIVGSEGTTTSLTSAQIPTGYTLPEGTSLPSYTFADTNPNQTIHLVHATVTLDPTQATITTSTTLPGGQDKTYPINASDLKDKTVTRTIKNSDGTVIATQTATYNGVATIDEITGKVTKIVWTKATGSWDKQDVTKAGYTAKISTDGSSTLSSESGKDYVSAGNTVSPITVSGDKAINGSTVNAPLSNETVTVTYTAKTGQHKDIQYVDDKGNQIGTGKVTGKTDSSQTPTDLPAGWVLSDPNAKVKIPGKSVDQDTPARVTIKHGSVRVDPNHPYKDGTPIPNNNKQKYSNVDSNDLHKTVTRTITLKNADGTAVTLPNGQKAEIVQSVAFQRGATVDTVDGTVKYDDWTPVDASKDKFAEYDVPVEEGYYADKAKVAGKTVDGTDSDSNVTVTYTKLGGYTPVDKNGNDIKGAETIPYQNDPKDPTKIKADQTIPTVPGYDSPSTLPVPTDLSKDTNVVGYKARTQHGEIEYVDDQGHVIGHTEISGPTDHSVAVKPQAPAGWRIVTGQTIPSSVIAAPGRDGQDNGVPTVTIKVEHNQITVGPKDPKTTDDVIPNDNGKKFPAGLAQDDLNKTETRTIEITNPVTGKTTKVTQDVTLTRSATLDPVTGEVKYSNWTPATFPEYQVPAVAGYTPSVNVIPAASATDPSKKPTVTITYKSNAQKTHIIYQDENGKTIFSQEIDGKTGETVETGASVPAGWELVASYTVPKTITFVGASTPDIVIKVEHHDSTILPTDPIVQKDQTGIKKGDNVPGGDPKAKLDNDVDYAALNKDVTRTIEIDTPNGEKSTIIKTTHLTRTADIDGVSGHVTYGKWTSGVFEAFNAPRVEGYHPNIDKVDEEVVKGDTADQTIKITYAGNPATVTISFEKPDGSIVKETLHGTVGTPIKIDKGTINVPAGYKLADGQSIPTSVTPSADGRNPDPIKIVPATTTISAKDLDNPNYVLPDNPKMKLPVKKSDLSKEVTRTITLTMPDGSTKTIKQTVTVTRTATVNEATGEVTGYSDWSAIPEITIPAQPGYIPTDSTGKPLPEKDGNYYLPEINPGQKLPADSNVAVGYIPIDNGSSDNGSGSDVIPNQGNNDNNGQGTNQNTDNGNANNSTEHSGKHVKKSHKKTAKKHAKKSTKRNRRNGSR